MKYSGSVRSVKITTDILLDSNARTMDENDQGNPEAEVKFKHSFDTYETLSAPSKRKKYDATLMHSSDTMGAYIDTQNTTHNTGAASSINFGNFTKDMERYFGFSFHISPLFRQCENGTCIQCGGEGKMSKWEIVCSVKRIRRQGRNLGEFI